MKRVITVCALAVLLAGCASDDLYDGRGGTASGAMGTQFGSPQWQKRESDFLWAPGGMPGTHPSDPRGGIGADDAGRPQ